MNGRLIFVDDEEMKRRALRLEAEKRGYEAAEAASAAEGLRSISSEPFDVVVTDLRMPRMDGLAFLKRIRKESPDTSVVIMTAYGTVANAVEAMKAGAEDYLLKPFSADELFVRLDRIMAYREALALNRMFLGKEGEPSAFHRLVGRSPAMQEVYRIIARVARSPSTVLITGESGTGKEVVAEAIHDASDRAAGPLVMVSCATLSRDVVESELFGHAKGAFTGALNNHCGRFEAADGGTLFLDDIDDIPLPLQVKLLRVLQSREVDRVGGDKPVPVDVRLLACTKIDLERLVSAGRFREDLYYRLNVVQIRLPPLRDRPEDIPLLARHFLRLFQARTDHDIRDFEPQALAALGACTWPGNVRELKNAIERAVTFASSDRITVANLPPPLSERLVSAGAVSLNLEGRSSIDLPETLRGVEERLLRWALDRAGSNQKRAAQLLGIPRTTLRDRLARLGLSDVKG